MYVGRKEVCAFSCSSFECIVENFQNTVYFKSAFEDEIVLAKVEEISNSL